MDAEGIFRILLKVLLEQMHFEVEYVCGWFTQAIFKEGDFSGDAKDLWETLEEPIRKYLPSCAVLSSGIFYDSFVNGRYRGARTSIAIKKLFTRIIYINIAIVDPFIITTVYRHK